MQTKLMYMDNVKCTYPTLTICHWLRLGLALGLTAFTLGPPSFFDTNMLVWATQKSRVGGFAVEYRVIWGHFLVLTHIFNLSFVY